MKKYIFSIIFLSILLSLISKTDLTAGSIKYINRILIVNYPSDFKKQIRKIKIIKIGKKKRFNYPSNKYILDHDPVYVVKFYYVNTEGYKKYWVYLIYDKKWNRKIKFLKRKSLINWNKEIKFITKNSLKRRKNER